MAAPGGCAKKVFIRTFLGLTGAGARGYHRWRPPGENRRFSLEAGATDGTLADAARRPARPKIVRILGSGASPRGRDFPRAFRGRTALGVPHAAGGLRPTQDNIRWSGHRPEEGWPAAGFYSVS